MSYSSNNSPLRLEALNLSDADNLFLFINSNRQYLKRYFPVTIEENKSTKDSKAYVINKIKRRKDKKEYVFTLKLSEENRINGLVIIKELKWDLGRAELAYCIDNEFRNLGWTTIAVQKILYFTFETLGLSVIEILSHKTNNPSIRVAEKCGFKWVRTLKESFKPPGEEYLDMELYEKTNEGKILPVYRTTTG